MTHLLYTYLTNENNDSFFADAQNNFSEEFINKISNYKRWEDAKATVLGRLLLAYGLKHFYDYDLEQLESFYHHWTQKEAIVKAHGSGLNIPLNSFEINNNTTIIENKQYFLKEIVLNSQYKCNVATHNIISDNVMELTCLKSKLRTDFGSSKSLKSFR